MAAIAGELSKQIKGHSEGAQGFRPWWDTVEDNLMYAFVILGMVTLPMTFFSKTPIECTPHPKNFDQNITEITKFSRFFPKVYCTEMLIEPFLLYLPFTLLMVPIVLTCIEKTYVVLYQVEDKMNKFYLLLVKESLNNEDVAGLAKDNVKDCHEIEQAFKRSNQCYTSYFYRTLLEILGSCALAIMFSFYYDTNGIRGPFFDCEVLDSLFQCIVPNSKFFRYVYVASLTLIGAYLTCSVYNFLWIVHPKVGTLSRFLDGCTRQRDSYIDQSGNATSVQKVKGKKGPSIRLNLYFKPGAHDFAMLMNLLAESQGLPESLRILAIFEHQFGMLWQPQNVSMTQKMVSKYDKKAEAEAEGSGGGGVQPSQLQTLLISWDDAEIADYFYSCYKRKLVLEYSVEIAPETEAPIKSILYYPDTSWQACETMDLLSDNSFNFVGDGSSVDDLKKTEFVRKYSVSFDGLEPGKLYKLTFSTEIDGRTITQIIRDFECVPT